MTMILLSAPAFDPLIQYIKCTHYCHFQLILFLHSAEVSVCWLLLSVQTCWSQQLAERPLGMHSVLIVSWVYICFIFRLSLDPGRQKEAQSFPRARIFLQEDRRWSLWVTQFLSTISQTASLPSTFPDYLHSSLQLPVSLFLCFPLNTFHHSWFPSFACRCSYV